MSAIPLPNTLIAIISKTTSIDIFSQARIQDQFSWGGELPPVYGPVSSDIG